MEWEKDVSHNFIEAFAEKGTALSYILDSLPEIVVLADAEMSIVAVNDAVEAMLGYDPSELKGESVISLYADTADRKKFKQSGFAEDPDQTTITYEARYLKEKGGVLEVETIIRKLTDEDGEVGGYLGVMRDISERKQAERVIEKFFSLPLNMMCTATPDGYFKEINSQFEEVLGYSKEELLSSPFIDLIHPEDVEPTTEEIEKLASGEREVTVNFENRYRRKDDSYCWLAWTATFDEESGLLYAIAQDVTERKELEQHLLTQRKGRKKRTGPRASLLPI